jgi:hypothetical protein
MVNNRSTQGGWMWCWVIHDEEGGGETSWPFNFLQLQLCDDRVPSTRNNRFNGLPSMRYPTTNIAS